RSKHLDVDSDGAFVNLLRAGGFVVLESDMKTEIANRLHLLTLNQDGKPASNSENIEGTLTKRDALKLIKRGASFSNAFFSAPSSQMKQVLREFGGARSPTLRTFDKQNDF